MYNVLYLVLYHKKRIVGKKNIGNVSLIKRKNLRYEKLIKLFLLFSTYGISACRNIKTYI